MSLSYLNRITTNESICNGKPCIRGMRWPVIVLLDLLGSGMRQDQILEDHPELEKEDVVAAVNYAILVMSHSPLIKQTNL